MKAIYLSLLLLLSLSAGAQTYVPFPVSDALWTERVGTGQDKPPIYHCFGLKNADTVIKSVTYHKLYRSVDTVLSESEYYGGIREEAKRIYLYTDTTEIVLYDFNLQVDDTFKATSSWPGILQGKVTQIDSVMIAGQYRKRYSFTLIQGSGSGIPFFGNWIEGIGNGGIGGLVQSFAMQPTCDCQIDNLCFKLGNDWVYHDPKFSSTSCVASVTAIRDPQSVGKASLLVAPNPVTGISRLLIGGEAKVDRIDIFNAQGLRVQSYSQPGNSVLIDRNAYAPGMYFYRLSVAGQTAGSGKFSVQ
ncbi:T9SS type A sorting domain-containing protein [Taibaiella chishuiensis]|uniref:Putative secreted protein (Por secretion system target) n=1 Tax=Taibaiella chishuiensis TaxID=1434707 RepID=A0A2P8D4U6_9BACT|nr:T9SS type A sorting domain-containing protein [Taibaiella chishuiensis]PSK92199.1 putative secreted protein (Por secretion system target) [Taibaiella chishuiensis]